MQLSIVKMLILSVSLRVSVRAHGPADNEDNTEPLDLLDPSLERQMYRVTTPVHNSNVRVTTAIKLSPNCNCISYFKCNISEPSEDDVDFREISKSHYQECGAFHVCCPVDDDPTYPPENPSITSTPTFMRSSMEPSLPVETCGVKVKENMSHRIIDDNLDEGQSKMGQHPWQVAMLVKEENDSLTFIGGGALVHPRFVITAPHIWIKRNVTTEKLIARVGDYDIQSEYEKYRHKDLKVKEVIVHDKANFKNGHNGIAILYLESPAPLGPNILPICLPYNSDIFTEGLMCTVTGWGMENSEANTYQKVLKVIDVPIVERSRCQNLLQMTRLGPKFELFPGFLCAGGEEGKDACLGDGGGPLTCIKNGTNVLAGVVLWGVGCGRMNVPAVYINVARYSDWIHEEMEKRRDHEKDPWFRGNVVS